MKNVVIGLLVLAMSTALASAVVPTEPKVPKNQHALQIVKVESTKHYDISSPASTDRSPDPVNLLFDDANMLIQYPVVYGAPGTSVTNDLTESIRYVDGHTLVEGKVVPEEHVHKIGMFISATISVRKGSAVTLSLNIQNEQIFWI